MKSEGSIDSSGTNFVAKKKKKEEDRKTIASNARVETAGIFKYKISYYSIYYRRHNDVKFLSKILRYHIFELKSNKSFHMIKQTFAEATNILRRLYTSSDWF